MEKQVSLLILRANTLSAQLHYTFSIAPQNYVVARASKFCKLVTSAKQRKYDFMVEPRAQTRDSAKTRYTQIYGEMTFL